MHFLIYIFTFFLIQNLQAANSLSYSGRLVQASGAPVTGPVNLRAELVYTNATSTVLCSQNLSSVALTKGVFHLKLDFDCSPKTITQILSETPTSESVAIRIIDQTNSKTYPFQAMHAIPFSKMAEQLPQMGASAGQALAWDGAKWAPTAVGTGNGTVTNIITGTGLTGGPIATTGTISIAVGGVGTTELANNSVTAAKINAGEITSSHISATANIPYSKLSIGAGEIPQDRINGLASSMSALIEDVIADAVTGKAPSQNAVYDALNLKADRSNVAQNITAASVTGLTGPLVGSDAANKTYVDNSATTLDTRITNEASTLNTRITNEVSTINTSLGNKYDKAGGVITGDVTLNTQLLLKGGSNFVTLKANSGTANYVMTLPTSAGTNGYVLQTDGAGVLSWVNPSSVVTGSGTVNSASITDGSIVDADINASANITQSKILNLTTDLAGKQPLITAGTTAQYYRGDKTFVDLGTDVRGTALTGFVTGANSTILNTDTTLGAFQKVQGQINATNTAVAGKEPALTAGTTLQYYRGDKSWQTLNGVAVGNTPAGNLASINVQTALNELDTEKQPIITATSAITTGSVTTSLQNGVNINPFNTGAGQTGELRFYELTANGSNYTSFKAPDALAANINYVMPSAAPTAGQVLSSSAAGVLSWISIPSAPVTTVFGRSGVVTATAGDYTATLITNTPAGSIAGTTVQAAINELDSEKQGLITAGTTAQYYRGDKTFVDFGTDVRGTALTGYTVGTNTALTATDSTLAAFQKVQGQINATNTAVTGKEPTIATGTTAQYIRGNKTLSTFATDVINSVVSTFTVGTGTKPTVTNTDTVAGAFGKVQKTLNDINADYVSKSQDQTINGTLAINSATGFITVPTPINPNDAANKSYVDSFGQWIKSGFNIFFNTGNVGIGTSTPDEKLTVNGIIKTLSGGVTFPDGITQTKAVNLADHLCPNGTYLRGFDASGVKVCEPVNFNNATEVVYTQVAQNYIVTCAIRIDSVVECWGYGIQGQLGDGNTVTSYKPVIVRKTDGTALRASKISAGGYFNCAIQSTDNKVYCWGYNDYGQLGNGTAVNSSYARPVSNLGAVIDLAAGGLYSCAIDTDTKVWCWGYNGNGEIGDGTATNRLVPTPTLLGVVQLDGVNKISAGAYSTCAYNNTTGTTVYCWGYNGYGQIGDNTTVSKNKATAINLLSYEANATQVLSMSKGGSRWASYEQSCAVLKTVSNTYKAYCWGRNAESQLADGTTTQRNIPTYSSLIGTKTSPFTISAFLFATCILESNNTASCIGHNNYGQLGNGTTTSATAALTLVKNYDNTGNLDVASLPQNAGGYYDGTNGAMNHMCYVTLTGRIACVGYNGYGNLGNGTTTYSTLPVAALR